MEPPTCYGCKKIEICPAYVYKKIIPGFEGPKYPDRLKKAEMCTLELRRLHADLCLCYNILHYNIDTPITKIFVIDKSNSTRGHTCKWILKNSIPRLDSRLHCFSVGVINVWNSLSSTTVEAASATMFKLCLKTEPIDKLLMLNQ